MTRALSPHGGRGNGRRPQHREHIYLLLAQQSLSFSELRRRLAGVNRNTLASVLRDGRADWHLEIIAAPGSREQRYALTRRGLEWLTGDLRKHGPVELSAAVKAPGVTPPPYRRGYAGWGRWR